MESVHSYGWLAMRHAPGRREVQAATSQRPCGAVMFSAAHRFCVLFGEDAGWSDCHDQMLARTNDRYGCMSLPADVFDSVVLRSGEMPHADRDVVVLWSTPEVVEKVGEEELGITKESLIDSGDSEVLTNRQPDVTAPVEDTATSRGDVRLPGGKIMRSSREVSY